MEIDTLLLFIVGMHLDALQLREAWVGDIHFSGVEEECFTKDQKGDA